MACYFWEYIDMKITLYKQCILSDSYTEVFDTKINYVFNDKVQSSFLHYLDTLEKFETEQEVMYMQNSGSFYFELANENNWESIYAFNYMKCENNNFTRFCFIDNIEIMNGMATVYYSTDIWHTYGKEIKLRESYLSQALLSDYRTIGNIKIKELPLEYSSNEGIEYAPVANITDDTTYYLIAQAQKYSLVSGGNNTASRRCFTVCAKLSTATSGVYKNKLSLFEAIQCASDMQRYQNKQFGDYFYEFDNFTIFPTEYMTDEITSVEIGVTEYEVEFNAEDVPSNTMIKLNLVSSITSGIKHYNGKEYIINNDYKTIGLGTFETEYGIINNGTDYKIKFDMYASKIDFKIIINYFGKMIDVTSAFVIDVPFNSINGETVAQRKIAREVAVINGSVKLATGAIQIGENIATFGASGNTQTINSRYRYGKNNRITSSRKEKQTTSFGGGDVSGIVGGVGKIVNGITDVVMANRKQYQTTYGSFVLGNKELNCKYGLIIKKIVPDNENEVNKIINNVGYRVYEIVDENIMFPLATPLNEKNVLKFDFVNAYGNAPQNIIEEYKAILLNGVKIWYDHSKINV